MKKILAILIVSIFSLNSSVSFASSPEEMQRRIDTLYKEYLRQVELENRMKFTPDYERAQQESPAEVSEPKRQFKRIDIKYEEVDGISKKKVDKILEPYSDFYVGKSAIADIQQKLQQLYFDKGYASTRIYVDGNTIPEDILTFVVLDGYIEDIVFKRQSGRKYSKFSQALQKFSFYPFPRNSLLNIKDLDQGLEQMNRLQTGNSVMEIIPSSRSGYSVVEVTNNAKRRFVLSLGADNTGIENTGVYKANASVNADNLFMLNDSIYFNYSHNIDGNDDDKSSSNYFASLSIPVGYFTFSFSSFNSDYETPPGISIGSFKTDGSTKNNNASVEMVIKRAQSFKVSAGTELALKDTKNNVAGSTIEASSRKLSVFSGFLTSTHYLKAGSLYTKLSYNKGLDSFDAAHNTGIKNSPKAQFDAYSFYAQFSTMFNMPVIKLKSSYSLSLNSQYSTDILYGSEQISIGGQGSVRGYKDEGVSGDSGGYLRNDLSWTLSNIFKRNGIFNIFSGTNISLFADYGYARHDAYSQDYQLAGAGAGISYRMKYFNAGFSWARSVYNVNDLKDEGNVLYFNLEAKYYF